VAAIHIQSGTERLVQRAGVAQVHVHVQGQDKVVAWRASFSRKQINCAKVGTT